MTPRLRDGVCIPVIPLFGGVGEDDLSRPGSSSFLRRAEYWLFRAGAFVILNVLDDPAWLALIFC